MLSRLFPKRFTKPGFIDNNGQSHVPSALLNIALHDCSHYEASLIWSRASVGLPAIRIL
jgi:hypothetical protein